MDKSTSSFSPEHPERNGTHPASYGIGIGGLFPKVKQTEVKGSRFPPSIYDVKKAWGYKLYLYECSFIVLTNMYALHYTVSVCQCTCVSSWVFTVLYFTLSTEIGSRNTELNTQNGVYFFRSVHECRATLFLLHSVTYSPYEGIFQRAVSFLKGTWWRKVTVSVVGVVIGIFHSITASGRSMSLGSTHPLTERRHQWYLLGYRWAVRRPDKIITYMYRISENSGPHPPGVPRDCPGLYGDSFNLVKPLKGKMKAYSYDYSARTSERTQFAAVMSTDLLISTLWG